MKFFSNFFLCKVKNRLGLILIVFFIGLGTNSASAQAKTVQGTITDESGEPLPGANVIEQGTSNGAVSDFDGNYIIDVSEEASLAISYVGFDTKVIVVGSQTIINVSLNANNVLDEVVLVGYGTQRKSDLTGSISSIGAKDFEKQPIFRVEDALSGRASGVQVSKNSGAPGADIKIRIRGANSISSNNQPLIVIDGIIGGELKSINTNDIQSMEILKDASATAIYGSRGANGVILVTTKKGSGKAKINVGYFTSVSEVPEFIDLLSSQEFATINGLTVTEGGADYQKEFFQTGITNNLQVSLSGSDDTFSYFISGNSVDQSGVSINTNYKRYSLRSNLNAKVNDKLSIGLNLFGGIEDSHNLVANGERTSTDVRGGITAVLGWDPTLPVKNVNGNYNLMSPNGVGLVNPIAVRRESDVNVTTNSFNANLNLSYKIVDNLTLNVVGGLLHKNKITEGYRGVPAGSSVEPPSANGSFASDITLQNSNILTWNKDFTKSNLKLTGIYEIYKNVNRGFSANGGPMNIPANFFSIQLGTTPNISSILKPRTMESWIGRGEYNYNRKLFLTATIRSDKSSVFASGNQTGIFPSISAAYQLDDIFSDNSFINRLKLRGGYGETGNQSIAPFSTSNTISPGEANFPINGLSESIGIALGATGNPDLTWETTTQTNIGVDFSFFNSRINLSADAYRKNTTDLLLAVPIPAYEGGGTILRNIGEVSNNGFEFNLDAKVVSTDKFNWISALNFSTNKNKVVSLTEGQTQIFVNPAGENSNSAGSMGIIRVGDPLGQFYGPTFLGTHQSGATDGTPGDARYLEDTDGLVLGVTGNGTPDYTIGFNNTLTYGNLDLNFLINMVQGFDVLNLSRAFVSLPGGAINNATIGEYRNRWTPTNETNIPATGNNFINSSRFIEDGSFLRLSNISLGYNIKEVKGFNSLRVYASAQNLFTITDYTGYDPEASSTSASSDSGSSIDWGASPNPRTFTFGINIGF
ncbi:TonB-dependent receptor [Maribacter sp.]|uniref:SusC/RagA family TonB-linked outer membrane protein n=1 Tax=Maribacter sp. TaxID=1897614 RepID=UPI0025C3E797|nr:TonB-dependent receptor [Maribacter sp.]